MATRVGEPTSALFALLIESIGLVIVVVVAGINDQVATLLLIFVIGLWLLFLMEHGKLITSFSHTLSNIEGGASK